MCSKVNNNNFMYHPWVGGVGLQEAEQYNYVKCHGQ